MTPSQRRRLIEKRQKGTLTDEENRQYQELLRNDPTFYDDVNLHKMLTEVLRDNEDQALWAAVKRARTEAQHKPERSSLLVSVWRNPYAIAACLAALLVVGWMLFLKEPAAPRIVKAETRDVRLVADSTVLGYDDYAGTVYVQWKEDKQLPDAQAYTFCRDTLKVFLKNPQDTLKWQSVELRFNSEQQILYLYQPDKSPLSLQECSDAPVPLPLP